MGRSRRRAGAGVSGEGAAVEAGARRRERRRGGVDIASLGQFNTRIFFPQGTRVRDQAIFFLVPGLRGSSPKDGQLHSAPPTIIGGRH